MKKIVSILFVSAVCIVLIIMFPWKQALVFEEGRTKQQVAYLPMADGDAFDIIFVHSIHLTDVTESYVVTGQQIEQKMIRFSQYGIGMPAEVHEGERYEYKDGMHHLYVNDVYFDSMNIRNGKTVSNHRLVVKRRGEREKQLQFNDYFVPGDWYAVSIQKLSLWQLWRGVEMR